MFKFLFFIFSALCYGSVTEPDKTWDERISLPTLEYGNSLQPAKKSELDEVKHILKDPDNIISRKFKIPAGLKDRVFFWAKIYAVYPYQTSVIHDRNDVSVIYKVVDIKDADKEKKVIRAVLDKIKLAGGVKNFIPSTPEEKRIRSVAKDSSLSEDVRVQQGQKDNIINGVKASSKYMPFIEDVFKKDDLPWELTRIPFVESSFNLKANSKVGARGIWQIMGGTGQQFMNTEDVYDERYSPFKASAVAAKILKENYSVFKNWSLAVTAYNHGTGGVKKACKQLKTEDLAKIVAEYKDARFGFASQNFYSEFLAALYVTSYAEKLFGHIEKEQSMNFYYVEVEKDITMSKLSHISGLSFKEIALYNPEFSKEILSGEVSIKTGSKIKLPPRASYKVEEYFVR
ncbi:MAG: lytic transglycosylase domain-containing protein [Pseudomonadota bacterium]